MRVTRHYSHKKNPSRLHTTTANLGKFSVRKISWHDNHIKHILGSTISDISSKATTCKTLGFLRRNLAFAPKSTKEVAYKTLERPKLQYAAPIWRPHFKIQIHKVEKVQRTAARWTCRRWHNTSSVGEMLDELQWPTLETQRD